MTRNTELIASNSDASCSQYGVNVMQSDVATDYGRTASRRQEIFRCWTVSLELSACRSGAWSKQRHQNGNNPKRRQDKGNTRLGGYPRLVEKYLLPMDPSCSVPAMPEFLPLPCSRRHYSRPPSQLGRGKHLLGREIPPPQIPPLSAPVALWPRTFGACQGSRASIFAPPLQKILVGSILGTRATVLPPTMASHQTNKVEKHNKPRNSMAKPSV